MFTIHRYSQNDTAATLLETFKSYESLGIRWSLPGGIQRIEIIVKTRNKYELHERMTTHAGQRIAIYSPQMSRPIPGWIYEVNSVGVGKVEYILLGGWRRLKDVYDVTVYDPADSNGDVLATALDDHCLFYNGDASGIETGGGAIGGWQVADEIGSTLQDITQDMMDMSDSLHRKYDFWFVDDKLNGNKLTQLMPYFQPRVSTADITWQVDTSELGGLNTGMGIVDTFSHFTIFYDTVGGTATGGSATTLVNADALFGATFTTDGVAEGDRVVNETDGSAGRVDSVDDDENLTISALSGGTNNVFAAGDFYTITMQNIQSATVTATPVNGTWTKYWREIKRGFNRTLALNYGNMLLDQKNVYQQQSPFTINSKTIRDTSGARWPLLEMIARGGGYLRINDLYPSASTYADSTNNSSTFFITALDYDNVSGQMRVVVDNPDRRIDVRLFAAGILNGEMVGRKHT